MPTKKLKEYQEKALKKLLGRTNELFEETLDKKTIVFQSPTGSGKTFMMSQYIEQLIDQEKDKDLCFLWISIGKGDLHNQSYYSLKREFQGFPECSLVEQEFFGSRQNINKNEVVVVNWEKLRTKDSKTGERKNILMKDKETTNFIELIQNTKEQGKTIVMIIDESHSNSTSERAKELRDDVVGAHLTIEMSATPVLKEGEYNEKISVEPTDVIEEGMIKKEIIINEHIDQIQDDELTSQEMIMQIAYNKRLELKEQYQQEGVEINPLVLVQIPSSAEGEAKQDFVESFLQKKGITYDNLNLSVWLSEEKINHEKEFVTPNQSDVDFLIFKQAIDTGWDCPRAQIMVRFREIRSEPFEVQTLGRILRMPEAKHYENDNLNRAYVFTNLQSIEVKKEVYNPNIIKSEVAKRKDNYGDVTLRSYYRNRIDFGDLTSGFNEALENTFCEYFGIKKGELSFGQYEKNKKALEDKGVSLEFSPAEDQLIFNHKEGTEDFDQLQALDTLYDSTKGFKISFEDLGFKFERVLKDNLNGFAQKRSISVFKSAVYSWFKKYLNIQFAGDGMIRIQTICLNNLGVFNMLFDKAVINYKPIKEEEIKQRVEETESWNDNREIMAERNYNPNSHTKYDYRLSLYTPCYLKFDSEIEKEFIEYLEKKNDFVEWWWQNGSEHMEKNFGIKYNTKGTFQPDFIVKFKDGKIGIFDTKAEGYQEADNKVKGEALQRYIKEENKKGKDIIGGLIIKRNNHFMINKKEVYKGFGEENGDWEYFDEVI